MYRVLISPKLQEKIKEANKIAPSISKRLEELEENPLGRAKTTGMPVIGSYYVNAGRYCILMEIDEITERVIILDVCLSSFLHKILKGKLAVDGQS